MIAIISDIHGNLPALQVVLSEAVSLGCTRVISLGDVVGYYAQPGECIDLLREYSAINIMGNHDNYLIQGLPCPRSRKVTEMMEYQRKIISGEQADWLSKSCSVLIEGENYFTHGGWNDPLDEYLYKIAQKCFPVGARNLFTGHTHVQALVEFGEKKYCNPGSVGQPRDGDPRAAFAVLSGSEVILHRIDYDIDLTANTMKEAGFPLGYYECLYHGAQIGGRIDKVMVEG